MSNLSTIVPMVAVISLIAGFAVSWGTTRATVAALQREIDQLRIITAEVVGLKARMGMVAEEVDEMRSDVTKVDETLRSFQTEVKVELARENVRRELSGPVRMQHREDDE